MSQESEYISLQEAAKYSDYSQEYLSLRARQGKLKSIKLGRNWVTKTEWLKEYLQQVDDYNFNLSKVKKGRKIIVPVTIVKKTAVEPPDNLPVEDLEENQKRTFYVKNSSTGWVPENYNNGVLKLSNFRFRTSFIAVLIMLLLAAGLYLDQNFFRSATKAINSLYQEADAGVYLSNISSMEVLDYTLDTFKEYGAWLAQNAALVKNNISQTTAEILSQTRILMANLFLFK